MSLAPHPPLTVGFATALADHGDRPALVTPTGTLTYAALAGLVEQAAGRLGTTRRLVLLAGSNTVETVVTYLAALAGGHVVLLVPGDHLEHLHGYLAAYDPDVLAADTGGGWALLERRDGSAHRLHPDLAVLLSTSGSTGSPKLVRLSRANLQSNAEAIALALGIEPGDRAATTLPLHYCYGLSVLNSHLHRGASLVLTGLSVVAPCFWDLVREHAVTTIAGVPHTFDLLDRVGFADLDLPSLRHVTQAGGRLAPERVRRYAELARERGWALHVMYGQTEATARMACLPPELAAEHPGCIGRPIPGGAFELDPVPGLDGPDAGELVYTGPNVMMGYALEPADLARGPELERLRTGDLARRTPDGLYEVVGRRSRFAKVVGLRLDLDRLEQDLAEQGVPARCADAGEAVVVVSPVALDRRAVAAGLAERYGIPAGSVRVVDRTEPPLLSSGKPDYPAMARLDAGPAQTSTLTAAPVAASGTAADLVRLYAELLDRPDATAESTFVGLGGDSLSYVEVSLRLEEVLGHLPTGWHLVPVGELATSSVPVERRDRWARVETSVVLRALAVLLILANHTHLADVPGGAHTLLGIAGFNFARFQLTSRERTERVRGVLRGVLRVLVPSAIWIGGLTVVQEGYAWHNPLMLNQVLGDHAQWSDEWHFWFIEVLLYLLIALAGLLAIPAVDRLERRWPFGLAIGVVGLGLLTRYAVVVPDAGPYRGATAYVLIWLFALGWAAQKAGSTRQRLLVSGLVVATLPGFWPTMPWREATIIVGLLVLLWVPALRLPRWAGSLAGLIASASLYIYLTHFAVYPHLMAYSSPLAMAACVLVGAGYWQVVVRSGRLAAPLRERAAQASSRARRAIARA